MGKKVLRIQFLLKKNLVELQTIFSNQVSKLVLDYKQELKIPVFAKVASLLHVVPVSSYNNPSTLQKTSLMFNRFQTFQAKALSSYWLGTQYAFFKVCIFKNTHQFQSGKTHKTLDEMQLFKKESREDKAKSINGSRRAFTFFHTQA